MTPINQPASPSAQHTKTELRPEEYNPEMAAALLAQRTAEALGTPTIISKKIAVYRGIAKTLNHQPAIGDKPGNPTGYDSSLRERLWDNIAADSVNIDGRYFERIWAYLMKPKYVISGTPYGVNAMEEERPSLASWFVGMITGKKPDPQAANNGNH